MYYLIACFSTRQEVKKMHEIHCQINSRNSTTYFYKLSLLIITYDAYSYLMSGLNPCCQISPPKNEEKKQQQKQIKKILAKCIGPGCLKVSQR